MLRKIFLVAFALVAFTIIFVAIGDNAAPASAQPADIFTIDWYTIAGGGATNTTGDAYSLSGTIGQPAAGIMNSASFSLNGGFWNFAVSNLYNLYLPFISK